MEFNADGSIKLPESLQTKKDADNRVLEGRSLSITKQVVKTTAPKSCTLTIVPSKNLEEGFVEKTYGFFVKRSNTPTKLTRGNGEYVITIGSAFSRCKDCTMFVSSCRDYLGRIIEKKGNCTYQNYFFR